MTDQVTLSEFDSYQDFVEKFKPKKTTDDCYTPPDVYEAVRDWAVNRYALHGREKDIDDQWGREFEMEKAEEKARRLKQEVEE